MRNDYNRPLNDKESLDFIQRLKENLKNSAHRGLSAEFIQEDGYKITIKVEKI